MVVSVSKSRLIPAYNIPPRVPERRVNDHSEGQWWVLVNKKLNTQQCALVASNPDLLH